METIAYILLFPALVSMLFYFISIVSPIKNETEIDKEEKVEESEAKVNQQYISVNSIFNTSILFFIAAIAFKIMSL